jgi:sugar (glycoside-pentoside-hexuronide) transporter
VFGVLTFLTPGLSDNGKAVYAAATYIVCGILYTGVNTPVTAILSVLTPDPAQRVLLTTYRMIGGKVGVLLVSALALPLVALLGHGNDKRGFMLTMPLFAAGAALLFLVAFRNLKEVDASPGEPAPVLGTFGALRGNWPWIIIASSSFLFWIAYTSRVSTLVYYFTYNLGRKDLVPLMNSLDIVSVIGIVVLPWLCRFTSKRNLWLWGLVGSVAGQFLIYFAAPSVPAVMAGWIFGVIASAVAMTMPFSLLSDSVDYGEWKTGISAAGLLTAVGASFCFKAGTGLGGALPAWTMAAYGYIPNARQTVSSLGGIELGFIWLPAAFFALALLPVLFYSKYEAMEPQIHLELEQRRAPAELEKA